MWSHLQAPGDSASTAGQVAAFERAAASIEAAGIRVPKRHLASSGGLLAGRAPAYDAVRIGLATYGLRPDDLTDAAPAADLRPVMSLHARPVRVAGLPAGQGISYGPSFTTERASRIATLPLGYGDGWRRNLSNSAFALVRGVHVPLVGTVSMDAVMADVTDVPGAPVTVDDEFVLIGAQGDERITALDVARSSNTIAWEVLSAMSGRLARVYTAAAEPAGLRMNAGGRGVWRVLNSGTGTSATSRSTRS
jgi:alanine racemase